MGPMKESSAKPHAAGLTQITKQLQSRAVRTVNPAPTLSEIRDLVATNSKQRYTLIHISNAPSTSSPSTAADAESGSSDSAPADLDSMLKSDADPANYLIRANQGHSVKIESGTEDLLTPISVETGNLPSMVVHGTREEAWPKIVASGGLKPMTRNHVHFATGLPASVKSTFAAGKADAAKVTPSSSSIDTEEVAELAEEKNAPQVISGMRNRSSILMFLDLRKALDKGLLFYMSENGVVLSNGDENGVIGLDLFERVENNRSGKNLVEDGKLIDPRQAEPAKQGKHVQAEWKSLPIREKVPMGDVASNN